MKRLTGAIAVALVALGTIGGLSACSDSSGPQNATQILQSDGYTPSSAYTSALQGGIGNSDGTILSSQAGTNNNSDVQAVVVFDNATDEQAGAAAVQSQFIGSGVQFSSSGDVLTATGPVTAWAAAGGGSNGL